MESYGSIKKPNSTPKDGKAKHECQKDLVEFEKADDPDNSSTFDGNPLETPIEEALDNAGFTSVHLRVLVIMGMAVMADHMELEVNSLLGPVLLCEWDLSSPTEALLTSSTFMGMSIGAIFWGKISDRYGRKLVIQIGSVIGSTAAVISVLSQGPELFVFARFTVGFSLGGVHVCYTYISECFGSRLRAKSIFVLFISTYVGSLAGSFLAVFTIPEDGVGGWRLFVTLTSLPMVLMFFLVSLICPESPRFLLVAGKSEKALNVIQSFNKNANKNIILSPIKVTKRGSIGELFRSFDSAILLISMSLAFFALRFESLGLTLLFYENLQSSDDRKCDVFVQTTESSKKHCNEFSTNDLVMNVLFTNAQLGSAILSTTLSDVIGRRFALYSMSSIGTVLFGLYFFCMPSILLTFSAMIAKCLILGSGMVFVLYINELYPTYIRSIAIGFADSLARLGLIISPFFAQYLSKTNYSAAVGVYLVSGFLAVLLLQSAKEETKNRVSSDSNQVDQELKK
ncbi:putative transporter svop-1 [Convolutriloba macropyga]|uniref:putative transporter svop-1 n=1 Tax=Convolutriloba macropyga TaxID=536237 RepID=UPI003F5237ED